MREVTSLALKFEIGQLSTFFLDPPLNTYIVLINSYDFARDRQENIEKFSTVNCFSFTFGALDDPIFTTYGRQNLSYLW